jgi:peptidoglycan glycosyltransferase
LGSVATQQTFPPGSTFKVVTTAAVYRYWPALAQKSYGPYSCLPLAQWHSTLCLQNSGGGSCGGTIKVMLPASCDPGYANIGFDLGASTLFDQARQFGYNSIPPLDLPGVVPSYFPPPNYFLNHQPSTGYAAIGQDNVRATALQDALVAAGIANRGIVLAPHFLRSIIDPLGNVVARTRNSVWRRPLTAAQAAQIVPLMQGVVQYGTAQLVGFLPQDDVAAKTGTAQTGVGNTNTDDWMIAFAPASDPVVAVAVVVPYQSLNGYGATVAGPIMKCVIEAQLAIVAGQPPAGTATTCPL